MRLPLPLIVALTASRELVRALVVPFRVLAYLPHAARWRQRAAEALSASVAAGERDELARFLGLHPPRRDRRGHVFVSCGETSGETHALHLVDAVAAACAARPDRSPPRWSGFGGARLAARGVDVRFLLSEHAVMGIGGVLTSIPLILRAFGDFLAMLRDDPPDLIVLIDYPGLHLVMAEAARRHGVPVVHYVAPQDLGVGTLAHDPLSRRDRRDLDDPAVRAGVLRGRGSGIRGTSAIPSSTRSRVDRPIPTRSPRSASARPWC